MELTDTTLTIVQDIKVKVALEQAMKVQRGNTGIALLYLTSMLDGGGWLTPLPGLFTLGMTRYPL
jgi:hypothetical protein